MDTTQLVQHPEKLFIDGKWIEPSSKSRFEVMDSATEERYLSVAQAQAADVNQAVSAARKAFDSGPWPRMSHRERAGFLRAVADELDKRADRHARIWTSEAGVLFSASKASMTSFSDTYRYYADLAETYPFEEQHRPVAGGEVAFVVREPVGVVGAIIPWNGAPGITAIKAAPALIAGCTIVLKSSPEAPGSAYLLAEACQAAGLPAGVLNIITADRDVSELLVRHPDVDKITFTGSTVAGRRIASICGERMARCTLELGGKSPALVLDDYDLETAAQAIASRAIIMTGQVCFSLTRIIVSRARHDDLVEALSSNFAKVVVGDPFDPQTEMGPLATSAQRARVEGYIARGTAEGARLASGGSRPPHLTRGYFVAPTIFGNVDNASTIAREEIFGPLLSVIPAESEEHALAIANDTEFGLNASVFTNDADRAYRLARRLRSGAIGHNALRREYRLPFGGFKQSGLGREGGPEGMQPYLETKVIIMDAMPPGLDTRTAQVKPN